MSNDSQLVPEFQPIAGNSIYSDPVLLSENSMTRLYRVSRDGKYFIIKTSKDNTGRLNALVRREYEISIGLDCPYVVNVFTYEQDTVVGPGIIMEYVDGRTLSEFLKENPPMQLRRRVFGQLLEAVAYLHRKSIIHNDLKPENILITHSDNTVKLIDFGLSDDDAHYLSKTPGCTPEYASPELLAHSAPLDVRSDIYSLGLLMRDIFGGKYRYISGKALRKDATKRYTNVEQMQKAFKRTHSIPLVAAAVLLFLATLTPYFFIPQQPDNRADELKELSEDMDDALKAATDRFLNRMDEIRFWEFACIEANGLYQEYWSIRDATLLKTDDIEIQAALGSIYTTLSSKHTEQFKSKLETIPKMSDSNLSREEFLFYIELLNEQKPYRPFEK